MEEVGSAGQWQVTCADGDVFVVDVDAGTLSAAGVGCRWNLESVDECAVGAPGAFTVRDTAGVLTPWFIDRIVSVSRI